MNDNINDIKEDAAVPEGEYTVGTANSAGPGEGAGDAFSKSAVHGADAEETLLDTDTAPSGGQDAGDAAPAEGKAESAAKKEKKRILSPHLRGFLRGAAFGMALIIVIEAVVLARPMQDSKLNFISILKKMITIEDMIDSVYLYDADKQDIDDGIFAGMLAGLTEDRYAAYYSAEGFVEENKKLTGSYVGIGITIYEDPEGRGIFIEAVNADGPAAKAGIRENDIITEADGISLVGASSGDAVNVITGKEGTEVVIKLLRDGEELEFTVRRETIVTVSVHTAVLTEDEIGKTRVKGTKLGYISITNFNLATLQLYEDALMELIEDEEVSGLIIDLRNNGGGDLEVCLSMLDRILDDEIDDIDMIDEEYAARRAQDEYAGSTLLLTVEGKQPGDETVFYASDGVHINVPAVVLVNGSSASASEIFSGTLKDYGYEVIGTTTYGKGIVQTLYNLDDGSAVKFTTDQYRLASGALIHGIGIEPTIEVEFENYDNETSSTVNYADGSEQDLMGDVQVVAAVNELEQQIYDAYQAE